LRYVTTGYDKQGHCSLAFSVSGDATAVSDSIDLISEYFEDDNVWLTHRLIDPSNVLISMMIV
jgi:hypothetical protein